MPAALVNDGMLWISTGRNRKEKSWKNKKWSWEELVAKLQKPYQTNETLKEYLTLPKDQQAEKKDIGGFVGGPVTGGRRKKGAVGSRSLITLDMDYAETDFWDHFPLFYSCAAFLYPTHSSTPEKPRLRLIIPLSREVLADEYEALSRRVAGDLGIDCFDDTTFQPERLMYWPSCPKDVKYWYKMQEGPRLDPDTILKRYYNWKDSSQWPISSRAKAIPKHLKKQQGDPHEKPGIIGAFCRTFSIAEAIDAYLDDIYQETDDENRFTFMGGSAAKGLVIYEDKFAFSHHGTDPISGKLCNAFDLVRIHLYGAQDETTVEGTAINKLPSYGLMKTLASQNKEVKLDLIETKRAEAGVAFSDAEDPEDRDWMKELDMEKKSGEILSTAKNVLLILDNDPDLKDCFQYNAFEDKPTALRDLPWRDVRIGEPLKDEDDACLQNYLEKHYNISNAAKISNAFQEHMIKNSIHPVRDFLKGLTWDGTERLDALLIDYFGAEDSEYVRCVTRKTLVAAVTRIFKPGCKFDNVLTLISEEGKNKSSFLEKLGTPWFSSDFGPLDNMIRAMEQVQGSWIIEIAELAGVKRSDLETVMHFVSKTEDRFRKAFGRRMAFCPRQCIFIATTNIKWFLKEARRHRRWWPVTLTVTEPEKDVWKDFTVGERRQIWAEAMVAYKNKESIHLPPEMEEEAIRIKDMHIEEDDREKPIKDYLNRKVPEDFDKMNSQDRRDFLEDVMGERKGEILMHKISPLQIWIDVFNGRAKDATPYNMKFIREAMEKNREWKKGHVRTGRFGMQRGWIRK